MLMSCSDICLLEVGARVSLKVATKEYVRGYKTLKIQIFRLLFQAYTEECDQKNQSFSGKFGMLMTRSDTYFLELSALISLKVTTKVITILKQDLRYYHSSRANFLLVTSYQLPVASYQLLVTSHQLLFTSHQLPVTSYQSLVTSRQLLVTSHQSPVTLTLTILAASTNL